ncbi:hypothetical protein ACNH6C_13885 [Bdellovibrio bacteriovorus]|uniref:hypothetical protein n=1 Tax=Bdellovibrio bacteriovorus TaxID=959 RepID=UPI003A80CB25
MNSVLIKWIKVDDSNFDSMEELGGSGLYMYTIKDLDDSPFYVGTAGETQKSSLRKRLGSNKNGFLKGLRTFVRRSAIEDCKGQSLSSLWGREGILFVPGTHKLDSGSDEGEVFYRGLEKYICKIDVPDGCNRRNYLRAVEAFIQNKIREVYFGNNEKLNFSINKNSNLLGQTNQMDLKRADSMSFVFAEDTMCDWFRRKFATKK